MQMRTLVIQSHRSPLPMPWLAPCIDSVRVWSDKAGYDYRWLDDDLFARVPSTLRHKTRNHLPMTADLARLQVLQRTLLQGYERAVWIDADVLIFTPENLTVTSLDHSFGREVWIQTDTRGNGTLRSYRKIHNAFMSFTATSSVLPFYLECADRILHNHQADTLAPQLIGPKLITALHNLAQFNVQENAAMLPPIVAGEIQRYQCDNNIGPALTLFNRTSAECPAAVNLCSSLTAELEREGIEVARLIDQLLSDGMPWPGISHD